MIGCMLLKCKTAHSISFSRETSVFPCPTASRLGFSDRSFLALLAASVAFQENKAGNGNVKWKTPAAVTLLCVVEAVTRDKEIVANIPCEPVVLPHQKAVNHAIPR